MHRHDSTDDCRNQGYVLVAAAVAALVITILGYTFFGLATSENKAARYRQDSVEAFYLADAAIERARARFLEDRNWRDGWSDVDAGNGSYDLVVTDTVYGGSADMIRLLATGRVGHAERSIEVFVGVPPTAFDMALFVMGDAEFDGELCLEGRAYVSGQADFGRRDRNLTCGGEYDDGFDLTPPAVRTEAGYYPGASYYVVRGTKDGNQYEARVYDAFGNDLTDRAGNDLRDVVEYSESRNRFSYDFDNHGLVEKYFDERNGVFRLEAGDSYVVVDFGTGPVGPINPHGSRRPGEDDEDNDYLLALSDVLIDGGNYTVVRATIINTRFTGVTESQRLDHRFWEGGRTEFKDIVLEPRCGLSAIVYDLDTDDGEDVRLGTTSYPGVMYVTGEVTDMNEDTEVRGSLIILDDFTTDNDFAIRFNDAFVDRLPNYFLSGWSGSGGAETSGTLEVVHWKEIAPVRSE